MKDLTLKWTFYRAGNLWKEYFNTIFMSFSPFFDVEISRPTKHAKTGKGENQKKKKEAGGWSPCLQSEKTSSAQILCFQTVALYKEN